MSQLFWEEDIDVFRFPGADARVTWHLKKRIQPMDRMYRVSLAWITREGDRKYTVRLLDHTNYNKTFRSLKAAKAYAVAIVSLD